MIRKFAMGLALVLLTCAAIEAQQPQTAPDQAPQGQAPQPQTSPDQTQPAAAQQTPQAQPPASAQTPAAQESSSSQEASDDELGRRRKNKVQEYKNWTYNVDAGANLGRGATKTFVKGGGVVGGAGVERNFDKYFGFRFDFQFVNLPLRASALQLAQAPTASDHVYAFTLDPLISIPVTREYTGYFMIGPSYYHRAGKLDSSTAVPGSSCNTFYDWWGTCFNSSLPLNGKFRNESLNQLGFNFGGGVAKKVSKKFEVYGEFRQQHGARSGRTTDWRSVTLGVRW